MNLSEKKKTIEYFSFWHLQNKITLFSLIAILLLSALFAIGAVVLPTISTNQFIAFIVLTPTLACFGIAACHSSSLESAKAQHEYKKLQSRLSEAEHSQITLDRFFSISTDLMAVAGNDGLLKKVSASLINTLGYNEKVLLSTPFVDFIHPDDQESTLKNIEALNLGIRSVGFENRYRAADKTYRTLSWSAAADAELGVRFASARDITEERNYQIRNQQILDSAPFLLLVTDCDGTITNCNAAFARSIGTSRDSLLGQKAKRLQSTELKFSSLEKEQQVIRTRQPLTFDEVLSIQGLEVRHLSTIFPIFDQSGNIVSIGKVSLNTDSSAESKT
ncbi:PAS domain-containing protein [Bdellovibrio svalbardensis]|uniref:PAS domain-containing protein n=1 Tax=Bdellovibrio svalbardensis TaxID=2972972 RepID=A0ABT6DHC2_9BACT|nr:PAS domain-containing protein [Bdellovibrio svalbardensis]MDG0816254.1 PAS domain-containing protein [Bdellovibrio svalbardensis]